VYCHDLGVCDYRRSMEWVLDLLTTCTHHSELHFTDHWHTDQFPQSITVSTGRFLAKASTEEGSSASRTQVLLSQPPVQNSCHANSANWVPRWRPFFTKLLVFSSQADFQLNCWQVNSLTHQPDISRPVTKLNSGTWLTLLITFRHEPHRNTVSIVVVQQYLDRCMHIRCGGNPSTESLPRNECLSAYCTATAVLVRFEVPARQWVHTPRYAYP
jgi:hypothetical protein